MRFSSSGAYILTTYPSSRILAVTSHVRPNPNRVSVLYDLCDYGDDDPNEPEEVATLPNLTQFPTRLLGDSVPDVKMPALERVQLRRLRPALRNRRRNRTAKINLISI
jgi:hypothetical protein